MENRSGDAPYVAHIDGIIDIPTATEKPLNDDSALESTSTQSENIQKLYDVDDLNANKVLDRSSSDKVQLDHQLYTPIELALALDILEKDEIGKRHHGSRPKMLVEQDGHLKICYFNNPMMQRDEKGLMRLTNGFGFGIDADYMLEELWQPRATNGIYSRKVDIYEVGLFLYEIFMGRMAFRAFDVSNGEIIRFGTSMSFPPDKRIIEKAWSLVNATNAVRKERSRRGINHINRNPPEALSFRTVSEDFDEIKLIGRGAFGRVCLVRHKSSPRLYAVKRLSTDKMKQRPDAARYMEDKLIRANVKSDWIVHFYGAHQESNYEYMVTEYMPGGNINNLLKMHGGCIPEKWAIFYTIELVLALDFIHDIGLIHGKVSPADMLLDRNGHLKLADFGRCMRMDSNGLVEPNEAIGTIDYISPEMLRTRGKCRISPECDYWSVGVILFQMLIGHPPFFETNLFDTYFKIIRYKKTFQFPKNKHISDHAMSSIEALLLNRSPHLGHHGIDHIERRSLFLRSGLPFDYNIRECLPPFVPKFSSDDDTRFFVQTKFNHPREVEVHANFKVEKIIGTGTFGVSQLLYHIQKQKYYFAKELANEEYQEPVCQECRRYTMVNVNSGWIVQMHCVIRRETSSYLVKEYIGGGNLSMLIETHANGLTEECAVFYTMELVLALDTIHKMGITHRDIRPTNILIDESGHLKLSDLGEFMAKLSYAGVLRCVHGINGSDYRSPEELTSIDSSDKFSPASDFWAVGIILYEMIIGNRPFQAYQISSDKLLTKPQIPIHFPSNKKISENAKSLIQALLTGYKERLGRNGIDDIKQHPLFENSKWPFDDKIRECASPNVPKKLSYIEKWDKIGVQHDRDRMLEILKEFEVVNTIGNGAFGRVQLIRHKSDKVELCVKKQFRHDSCQGPKTKRHTMSKANSDWINRLYYDVLDKSNSLCIVMGYMPGGNIANLLSTNGGSLPEKHAVFYTMELVLALDSMHTMGFIHRNVNPRNMLLDQNGHLKLSDYGMCLNMNPLGLVECSEAIGTVDYSSPEELNSQPVVRILGRERDFWSVGIILYEMIIGVTPFYAENVFDTYCKIMQYSESLCFPSDIEISENAKSLIQAFLTGRENRLGKHGIDDIKQHSFFHNTDWPFDQQIRKCQAPFVPELSSNVDTRYGVAVEYNCERKAVIFASFDDNALISKGKFGDIQGACHQLTKRAIKVMPHKDQNQTADHGLHVMTNVNSDWILNLVYAFQDDNALHIVTEYMCGGSMAMLLKNQRHLITEEFTAFYAIELVLALDFVHNMGIIHRDINPRSILLDGLGHIKLSDLGTSNIKMGNDGLLRSSTGCNDIRYKSPEIRQSASGSAGATCGREIDYWSVGIVLYEMIIGVTPCHYHGRGKEYELLHFPSDIKISKKAESLIRGFLIDHKERLGRDGITDIKRHPFFQNSKWPFDESIRNSQAPFTPDISDDCNDIPSFVTDENPVEEMDTKESINLTSVCKCLKVLFGELAGIFGSGISDELRNDPCFIGIPQNES